MRLVGWSVFIYALIVAAGGIFGCIRAHSLASLFASLPFAIVLLACTPGVFLSKRFSLYLSLLLVLLLDAFFTYRFSIALSWMPAGMMMLLSLVTLTTLLYGVRKRGSAPSSRNSS